MNEHYSKNQVGWGNKNHSTQDSRVVPHRGTNWAALWLTAQIGRDAVLSESYGRGYYPHSKTPLIGILNIWKFGKSPFMDLNPSLLQRALH